jgi:hypothetical protein
MSLSVRLRLGRSIFVTRQFEICDLLVSLSTQAEVKSHERAHAKDTSDRATSRMQLR